MNWIQADAEALTSHLSALRRNLHRCPEAALQERETAAFIRQQLEWLHIPFCMVGDTGIAAFLRGAAPGGGVVALRADIDALPILEQTGAPWCSTREGFMHACGHDAHTAILLGTALLLARRQDYFHGQVRFFFQPGEETGRGAMDFLHAGLMEGVERVFGLHVAPDLPLGTIGLKPGLNNAAVDAFRIEIRGRAAHVSTPQLGVDALYIASMIVVALQAHVTRCSSPTEPVLLGIGTMHSGTTYNIVADSAFLEGTTRTVSPEARMRCRRQIEATVASIAALYGGEARVLWDEIASAVINDPRATEEVTRIVRSLRPDLTVCLNRPLSLGGDNFSEFETMAPGVYAYLGTSNPHRPETCYPIHTPNFDLDETALPIGVWLHSAAVLNWLGTQNNTAS